MGRLYPGTVFNRDMSMWVINSAFRIFSDLNAKNGEM